MSFTGILSEYFLQYVSMLSVTKLRTGVVFEYANDPWRVTEYKHVHLSRGSGTITIKARNLRTGSLQAHTFKSGDKVQEAQVERRAMTYLYPEEEHLIFMHPETFEQVSIPASISGAVSKYAVEGTPIFILLFENKAIDIDLPPKVSLTVKEASPGVKGDTVAGATKDVILETNIRVRVPLFINAGDKIRVDTRTGEYIERTS